MSLGGWALANPAGLAWCLLALPIVALHVLRPRRIQARVAALYLWQRVATPVSAARPWQRLIPSWLLLAQVLTALLLGVLLARPVRLTDQLLAEHTVFVIDASASMQTTDGDPDRLAAAVARAAELREQVPAGGTASLVVADARPRAVLTRSADVGGFDDALAALDAGDGSADFAGAFALAAGLDTPDIETRVVFISDGGVSEADLRTAPLGTRYEKVGRSGTNRGISQLTVEPAASGLTARVTVTSYGGPEATAEVRIDVDGITAATETVTLAAGEVANLAVPIPAGERVEAFLGGGDALALDDRVVATVSRRPSIQVLWAGPDNPFLGAALGSIPGAELTRVEQIPATIDPGIDLVVADRVAVPDELDLPLLAVAPPGGARGVEVAGTTTDPVLTLVRGDVPLLDELDLSEVYIAGAQQVTTPTGAEVLLGAEGVPLLLSVADPEPALYLTFALDESTLPLQAAFPLLVDRAVTDLTNLVTPPARLVVGAELPVDARIEATVTGPDGTSTTFAPGATRPSADRVGFWQVEQPGRAPLLVAVTPDRAESTVTPAPSLPFETAMEGTGTPDRRGESPIVAPLIGILLALVAAELLLARRRRGVGPRQWRVATALRAAVALALVGVLISPTFDRSADEVATVFLVDASDSMTAGARAAALAAVTDGLAAMPDGARAGVVVFGQDARLESLISADPVLSGITVEVDPAGTDLAAAIRLGAAALPADARRRMVLVSDGRATSGDARAEAKRLAADGIPLDVVVIEPPSGSDIAVSAIDAASAATVGERVDLDVAVVAAETGPAVVTLTRDGEEVERREVDLEAGTNTVTFSDTATDEGLLRYQVEVEGAGDRVGANDVGYAAVPVSGSQRVLVVDGRSGSGDAVVASLAAGGIEADRATPASLPAADELSGYASVILVDVDRRDLSDRQVSDLSAAVRDLGRGMVVIGGTSSYALGGYRDSDLEELLPVVSEITDPLRRQTVAEVLAIDTSGSMAACHCDENGMNGLGTGDRLGGGVEKTTIAANAVVRAIDALENTDEVGVLSLDADDNWLLDLQAGPSEQAVTEAVSGLVPDGPTYLDTGLETAAGQLRTSDASLKHIILFSDGFTEPAALDGLADQAADLLAEGITVSVVATGEGAAADLEPIAEAGGGRFYPGRNLSEIPELIVQEAVVASRDFVTEGEFSPLVTSSREPVRGLDASPPLLGYVATTAKPTASVDLRIGPDEDPLLASWQIGLGRVSAWTSDGGERWSTPWVGWDGSPDFWAGVVKDTFPTGGEGAAVETHLVDGQLQVSVVGDEAWSDDAVATVRLAAPDGTSSELALERVDGSVFTGAVAVSDAGTYAVGATVTEGSETLWGGIGLATRPYPAEYAPRPVDRDGLGRLADLTGGRVDPPAAGLFDPAGTVPGVTRTDLRPLLLLLAVLLWPLAVALSRLSWRRGVLARGAVVAASHTVDVLRANVPKLSEPRLARRRTATVEGADGAAEPVGATTSAGAVHVGTASAVVSEGPAETARPDRSTGWSDGGRRGTVPEHGNGVGSRRPRSTAEAENDRDDGGGDVADEESSTLSALLARKRSRE